ncbi:MAG: hypothetical protein HC799_07500 [Limnothrix sp. RL_2_0]|nr:hypothetical protein [Limnothrix sp. RL_2_0]
MSRFSKIIDQLEDLDQQDLKNSAKLFGITAELYQKLSNLTEASRPPQALINSKKVTQKSLTQRYGGYGNTYQIYKEKYGIKCKTGWKYLLPLIQDLPMPETVEERIAKLEKKVLVLSEILLTMTQEN